MQSPFPLDFNDNIYHEGNISKMPDFDDFSVLECKSRKSKRNKKRYDSELPYQRPDLIEVMEIEIDLTTSTNVHTGFYISVRECLD